MQSLTIPKEELNDVLQAYLILRDFLEKYLNKEDIYTDDFIKKMDQASNDILNHDFDRVETFDDFIK